MKREKKVEISKSGIGDVGFMASDLELGILENEVYQEPLNKPIRLMKFDRILMVVALNDKLTAN